MIVMNFHSNWRNFVSSYKVWDTELFLILIPKDFLLSHMASDVFVKRHIELFTFMQKPCVFFNFKGIATVARIQKRSDQCGICQSEGMFFSISHICMVLLLNKVSKLTILCYKLPNLTLWKIINCIIVRDNKCLQIPTGMYIFSSVYCFSLWLCLEF